MTAVEIEVESDRWIRVPLDYADTQWDGAAAWAQWLADAATRGRPDAELVAPFIVGNARRATADDLETLRSILEAR